MRFQESLAEESITFNRVNPAWDRFPTLLSVIHLVSLKITMTYRGYFSKHTVAPETGSLTSNWVTERSSQYLIHLVKFTNNKPRNNLENKKIFKKTSNIFILIMITDLTSRNARLI